MADNLNLISNIGKSSGNTGKITFPENLFENANDYIKFSFYKYKGPFQGGNSGTVDTSGKFSKDFQKYNQAGAEYKAYDNVKNIMLYMPEDISTGYQVDYAGKGFSNIASNVLKAAGSATTGDGGGTAAAVGQLLKNAGGALPTAAAETLAGTINAVGGGDLTAGDVLQGTYGVVLNPNTELMFQGFKLRTFTLRFKLAPRNAVEAQNIREIIGTFKKVSLPTFGQDPGGFFDAKNTSNNFKKFFGIDKPADASGVKYGGNANYIGVPGLCQVKFMAGENIHPYLPQYKLCAISDVSVNYTPDGAYSVYGSNDGANGSPVATELQLTFSETKLIYSQDINPTGASY